MNLDYLKKEIIPQREKEIEEGKNLATRQPIYVVYNVVDGYTTLDTEYSNLDNLTLYGYDVERGNLKQIDGNDEYEWKEDYEDGDTTKFYRDVFTAIFFTRKGAEEYMKYQKHNLSDKAYIYTHYSGYANIEMDKLLDNK